MTFCCAHHPGVSLPDLAPIPTLRGLLWVHRAVPSPTLDEICGYHNK